MLMAAVGTEPSVWGEVVPSWLGGLGGLGSALVALSAFILGLRNRRSVASVKEAVQPGEAEVRQSTSPSGPDIAAEPSSEPRDQADFDGGDIGATIAHGVLAGANPPFAEPWSVMRQLKTPHGGRDLAIGNSSDRVLNLIGIEIFNGTEWNTVFLDRVSRVEPRENRYFDFKASGGRESNINVIQVTWIEEDGSILSQRVLL